MMLLDRILGNLYVDAERFRAVSREIDEFSVNWWELDRRAFQKTTDRGCPVRVLLPLGTYLTDGDVLHDDGDRLIVARLACCEVWVARPADASAMAVLALEIGNLHAPAEVLGNEILIAPDGPAEACLANLKIPHDKQLRRFHPRRCAGMPVVTKSPSFQIRTREV